MNTNNYHNFTKFYKGGKPEIITFLRSYVYLLGVTVAKVLSEQIKRKYDVSYNPRWITVILKSASIPRATRKDRRKKPINQMNLSYFCSEICFGNRPGLVLFDILFMQGPGKVISDTIESRDSHNFVKKVGIIFASGQFKRLYNYESGMIEGINNDGKSLARRVMNLTKQEELGEKLNSNLLDYWLEAGINIERLFSDGHIKISYTKYPSLAGKISSSGRIAPGTKMVLIHQQQGFMLWLQMHKIDEHLGEPFIEDSIKVLERIYDTQKTIPLIVDKEGSGKELSTKAADLGVFILTLVKSNSYKGIEDFVGDLNSKGLYRWANNNKNWEDSRYFYPVEVGKDKLIVYSINSNDNSKIEYLPKWYKERWNGNENPIKVLVGSYYFNTNVGQGVDFIENPKQLLEKEEAEKKLPLLEYKLKKLEKKKPRLAHTIVNKDNEIKKTKKKIEHCDKVLNTELKSIAIRKTEGDWFLSILKGQLYNVLLYLLIQVNWPDINPQEVFFVHKALIRRQGELKEFDNKIVGRIRPLREKKDRIKQEELLKRVNNLQIRTNNGKLLSYELFDLEKAIVKNSSFG